MPIADATAYLMCVLEVSFSDRIRCQAAGCGHAVYKRIHVVLVAGEFTVLGSQCFSKLYGGGHLVTSVPYFGGGASRQLSDEERAMLVDNTARFIQYLKDEQNELIRLAAISEAERVQEKKTEAQHSERELATTAERRGRQQMELTGHSMLDRSANDAASLDDTDDWASDSHRYIWSSSWWKSSADLHDRLKATLRRQIHFDVVYRALVQLVRQPTISPIEFADRLRTSGVPRHTTLQCLTELKLAVRGKLREV